MAKSKDLEKAVEKEVDEAADEAETGDVETVPQEDGGPQTDLATGDHSRRP